MAKFCGKCGKPIELCTCSGAEARRPGTGYTAPKPTKPSYSTKVNSRTFTGSAAKTNAFRIFGAIFIGLGFVWLRPAIGFLNSNWLERAFDETSHFSSSSDATTMIIFSIIYCILGIYMLYMSTVVAKTMICIEEDHFTGIATDKHFFKTGSFDLTTSDIIKMKTSGGSLVLLTKQGELYLHIKSGKEALRLMQDMKDAE